MEINILRAIKQFFPNPSLEMVYFEAVANAIDAGAKKICIVIQIEAFSKPETLMVTIEDDGCGFSDDRFYKFGKLLETEEEDHKGLGRLVFLNYFDKVGVESVYHGFKRDFEYSGDFISGESEVSATRALKTGSKLFFSGYRKKKVKKYDYLKPSALRKALLLHFFPQFHAFKKAERELEIEIELICNEPNHDVDFFSETQSLTISDIPDLEKQEFKGENLDLFESFELNYSVEQTWKDTSVITAVIAEGRTIKLDILDAKELPQGYEVIFLLYSPFFKGKVNDSRQKLDLDESTLRTLKRIFASKVGEILNQLIPDISSRNKKVAKSLNERYPHLLGYFDEGSIGLIDRNKTIEIAQKRFFQDQKTILEAKELTDTQYEKSLELSGRLLTEYVLYRNKIIQKLGSIDRTNSENEIHDIFVPRKNIYREGGFIEDIYSNNAWLLDDKYMAYSTIISERKMEELLKELKIESDHNGKDASRPDISMVFSAPPDQGVFEVVIIEFKKENLKLAKREEVISQLKQRARRLAKHFGKEIQRIWFYGIVDIDEELRMVLAEEKWSQLFSNGEVYYKPHDSIYDLTKPAVPTGLYLLSYDSILEDAELRNRTFLRILKDGLKRRIN